MITNAIKKSNILALTLFGTFALAQAHATGSLPNFTPAQLDTIAQALYSAPNNAPTEPNFSLLAPSAFGANWGDLSANIGGTLPTPTNSNQASGSASLGIGLGDSRRYAGLEINMGIISINPGSGFLEEENFNFKLHRDLPDNFAIAIGANNVLPTGGTIRNYGVSTYLVGSKIFILNPSNPENAHPLLLSLGAGNGTFYSNNGLYLTTTSSSHYNSYYPFASAGLQILPKAAVIADYTAKTFGLGLSVVPITTWPVAATIGAENLNHAQGPNTVFLANLGYSYQF